MGCVVSVEHVVLSFATGDTSKAQDLTLGQTGGQCVPMFVSVELNNDSATAGTENDAENVLFAPEIYDNAGTPAVRATRGGSGNNVLADVSIYVVEFINDINVYSGSWTSTSADEVNETVTAVSINKSMVFGYCYGVSGNTAANADDNCFRVRLQSTTNVRVERLSSGSGFYAGFWYVAEDSTASTHFSVQHRDWTSSAISSTCTAFTAVDTAKTFIICSGASAYTSYDPRYVAVEYDLDSTTTVRAQKHTATSNQYHHAQVVELQADDAQVERGLGSMSSATSSNNPSLVATFGENSAAHIPNGQGFYAGARTNSSSVVGFANLHFRAQIDAGSDGVDILREPDSTSGSITCYYSWEAVDFGLSGRRLFIT